MRIVRSPWSVVRSSGTKVNEGLPTTDFTDYRLWTMDCGPRTTDYGPRTTDHGLRTTDYGPRTTDHGLRTPCLTLLGKSAKFVATHCQIILKLSNTLKGGLRFNDVRYR